MSKEELLDIDEACNWEPKENESRGKIRKYKCECLNGIEVCATIRVGGSESKDLKVTKENIEEIKASRKKDCDWCGGTGIMKVRNQLYVHTVNFDINLSSNYSPIYGNIKCFAAGFLLEEAFVHWDYEMEEWDKWNYDDDHLIDEDKPFFLTSYLGEGTERFTFDGVDIIRLFELKGYDFDDTDDYWWQRDYFGQQGGSYHHKETNYIDTHNFNSSLLKFNFEEEDTYETCMKKWESFKRSFKKVSSVDHFYPRKWDDNEKKFRLI